MERNVLPTAYCCPNQPPLEPQPNRRVPRTRPVCLLYIINSTQRRQNPKITATKATNSKVHHSIVSHILKVMSMNFILEFIFSLHCQVKKCSKVLFYIFYFIWNFSSVQSLSPVRLFVTPWTATRQASLSITNSQSLLMLMSIELMMSSNLSSPSPPNLSQHQGLFQWVSTSHQVAKLLEFQLQHQSF